MSTDPSVCPSVISGRPILEALVHRFLCVNVLRVLYLYF